GEVNRAPAVTRDAMGSPHSKQNFAPAGSSLRHFVQVSATRAPHSRQNFAWGAFSCWHRGHCMSPPEDPRIRNRRGETRLSLQGGQPGASTQNFGYRSHSRTSQVTDTNSSGEGAVTRASLREYAAVQRERYQHATRAEKHRLLGAVVCAPATE